MRDMLMQHHLTTGVAEHWLVGVEQSFRQAHLRWTPPRRAIVAWIAARSVPFTAEDLVADLARSSRATSYRMIEWLRGAGWITRLHSDPRQHAYIRIGPGHHHHLLCIGCGMTRIVQACTIDQSLERMIAGTDFAIQGHVLEFFGLCKQCQHECVVQ